MSTTTMMPKWWAKDCPPFTIHTKALEAWLAELRSGKRTQGVGSLAPIIKSGTTEVETFCCLGVLCEALKIGRVRHDKQNFNARNEVGYYEYEEAGVVLPMKAANVSGLERIDPRIPIVKWDPKTDTADRSIAYDDSGSEHDGWKLSELNDDGFTFPQIADLIEYFAEVID